MELPAQSHPDNTVHCCQIREALIALKAPGVLHKLNLGALDAAPAFWGYIFQMDQTDHLEFLMSKEDICREATQIVLKARFKIIRILKKT